MPLGIVMFGVIYLMLRKAFTSFLLRNKEIAAELLDEVGIEEEEVDSLFNFSCFIFDIVWIIGFLLGMAVLLIF